MEIAAVVILSLLVVGAVLYLLVALKHEMERQRLMFFKCSKCCKVLGSIEMRMPGRDKDALPLIVDVVCTTCRFKKEEKC